MYSSCGKRYPFQMNLQESTYPFLMRLMILLVQSRKKETEIAAVEVQCLPITLILSLTFMCFYKQRDVIRMLLDLGLPPIISLNRFCK